MYYLTRHVDLKRLAREEGVKFAFACTPLYRENLRNLSLNYYTSEEISEELALLKLLLDIVKDRDITEFIKPF
jgi:hypothetical protein